MPSIRRILLVGHTHHDVGYTNSPRIVDGMHARIVHEILDLCDEHADEGADQFRWTFEVARPVLNFLSTADERDVARLARLVDTGRISVTGGYLNMTQLPSDAEFGAAYDRLDSITSLGIPVRTEQHGDVNGTAWGTVAGMRRAGIDRLVMALNPDHGRPPFAQPTGFWWQSPAGERVFTWLSTHYGFGEEWGIIDGDVERAERNIVEFLAGLETRDDYPYDTAIVHAANDNRWPTALFLDVVRHWNLHHPEAPMRTATIDDALDVVVEQALRADIPVVRGEWSDWWSHGHGSTAREVAAYRQARSFARAAQTSLALATLRGDGETALATVLGYRRGPVRLRSEAEIVRDLEHVDDQLLLFGEHTWGSWETYSKPHSMLSHSHWNAKAGFAYDAYDHARDLAIEGLFRVAASGPDAGGAIQVTGGESILVFNPTERDRTEPVTVEVDGRRRASTVATVPAFGTAVVPVPAAPGAAVSGREIHTDEYSAIIDPARGGIVSLIERATGRELVDASAAHGLGAVVVETVPADSTHPMVTRDPKLFHPDFPGPDFVRQGATGSAEPDLIETDELVRASWTSTAPGVPHIRSTLTFYKGIDAIDLEVRLEKPESFGPESVFVAFPFAVADPEFLLETAGAVYAAETEQLADTSKDWFSIQHAVGVNGGGSGILWGTFDAPLVQLGGFHTGEWARTLAATTGHVNSWLMNNLHFTNFQARQDGTGRYRYRFAPRRRPVTRDAVRLYGRDLLEPLQARQYDGPLRPGASGLVVSPSDSVIAELRPLGDGEVRVRLRNVTLAPVTASVSWNGTGVTGGGEVELLADGVADLVLRRDAR
jgi:alpha-mannosidase